MKVSNMSDIIDSRDIIEEIDDIQVEIDELVEFIEADPTQTPVYGPEIEELRLERNKLVTLIEDVEDNSEDSARDGITMIRDSYFEDYAQELAEDTGAMDPRNYVESYGLQPKVRDLAWPLTCIDWKQAARELQHDYYCVEFDGVKYWVR